MKTSFLRSTTAIAAGVLAVALASAAVADDQQNSATSDIPATITISVEKSATPFNAVYDEATKTFIRQPIEGSDVAETAAPAASDEAAATAAAGETQDSVTRKYDQAAETFTTDSAESGEAAAPAAATGATGAAAGEAAAPAADATGASATDAQNAAGTPAEGSSEAPAPASAQ